MRPNRSLVGLGGAPRLAGCRVGLRASSLTTTLDFYLVVYALVYTRQQVLSRHESSV